MKPGKKPHAARVPRIGHPDISSVTRCQLQYGVLS